MKTTKILDEEPPGLAIVNRSVLSPIPQLVTKSITIPNLTVVRRERSTFILSRQSADFLRRFYPEATKTEWNDWRWQNRHRVRTLNDLARMIELSEDESEAISRHTGSLPVGITPYYASLMSNLDPTQGLRRTVVPVLGEYEIARGENEDPLGEDSHSPVPGLVHRYPDRVLLLVTNFCSVYCRYCTRARMVGSAGERSVKKGDIELALNYIEQTPAIVTC